MAFKISALILVVVALACLLTFASAGRKVWMSDEGEDSQSDAKSVRLKRYTGRTHLVDPKGSLMREVAAAAARPAREAKFTDEGTWSKPQASQRLTLKKRTAKIQGLKKRTAKIQGLKKRTAEIQGLKKRTAKIPVKFIGDDSSGRNDDVQAVGALKKRAARKVAKRSAARQVVKRSVRKVFKREADLRRIIRSAGNDLQIKRVFVEDS